MTVNGQTITATPSDGAWSIDSPILANATYPIVASVVDGAGNPGSATQQLTVDTVLPVITIDGGPSVTTNDPTPTISGTSDVAPGTTVHVAIGTQERTALVQAGRNVGPHRERADRRRSHGHRDRRPIPRATRAPTART